MACFPGQTPDTVCADDDPGLDVASIRGDDAPVLWIKIQHGLIVVDAGTGSAGRLKPPMIVLGSPDEMKRKVERPSADFTLFEENPVIAAGVGEYPHGFQPAYRFIKKRANEGYGFPGYQTGTKLVPRDFFLFKEIDLESLPGQ